MSPVMPRASPAELKKKTKYVSAVIHIVLLFDLKAVQRISVYIAINNE